MASKVDFSALTARAARRKDAGRVKLTTKDMQTILDTAATHFDDFVEEVKMYGGSNTMQLASNAMETAMKQRMDAAKPTGRSGPASARARFAMKEDDSADDDAGTMGEEEEEEEEEEVDEELVDFTPDSPDWMAASGLTPSKRNRPAAIEAKTVPASTSSTKKGGKRPAFTAVAEGVDNTPSKKRNTGAAAVTRSTRKGKK